MTIPELKILSEALYWRLQYADCTPDVGADFFRVETSLDCILERLELVIPKSARDYLISKYSGPKIL